MEESIPPILHFPIYDPRQISEFKTMTFSNYKKIEVKDALIKSMSQEKVEPACHWCAELICSGQFMEIWETLLLFIGKHIHIANPKIVIYLQKRFSQFRDIMIQGHFATELELRNNRMIRNMFAEIVCIMSTSAKKNSFEQVKIQREEFDMTNHTRIKADSLDYARPIMKKEDPLELTLAINEFSYDLKNNNMLNACYWIEWLIEFDVICKTRGDKCFAEKRTELSVENKHKCDIIWILWEAILYYGEEKHKPEFIQKTLLALHDLFCIKYTTGTPKKRRYLLYFAVELITETVDFVSPAFITDRELMQTVVDQIDQVYKQIKKHEIIDENANYMFMGLSEKEINLKKSLGKMELMNSADYSGTRD